MFKGNTTAMVPAPAASLNDQQRSAVEYPHSVLVLSGAGTGKTRVIAARVARLLENKIEPAAVLALTYTNKAAGEMRARIGSAGRDMFIGTFHSFGRMLLREHAADAGLPASFQILDSTDQTSIVRRILQHDMQQPKPAQHGPDPAVIRGQIEKFKERGLRSADVSDLLPGEDNASIIKEAYQRYERQLRQDGKADFAELLLRCVELLRDYKKVRAKWQQRFAHILIDELQDINELQMRIIGLLKDGTRTVMFGVGDDDQSIYGFRGANPRHLRDFADQHAAGKVLRLVKNYRSTERILALANEVIRGNDGRLGKTLTGTGSTGALPSLEVYPSDYHEAQAVARQIAKLRADNVAAAQITVLYRNNALSQLLETALVNEGVPFRIRGGARFFARQEVKDIVAYLQVAAQPDNNVQALMRSVNQPPRRVGDKIKQELAAASNAWQIIKHSTHPGLLSYRKIIDAIRAKDEQSQLVGAVEAAVVQSGLQEYLNDRRQSEKAGNLDEIISAAARFAEHEGTSRLDDFLAQITLEPEVNNRGEDQVELMTIHAAKGLEFDYVFVIGIEQGILPSWNSEKQGELSSECRLLYVAITRARRALHLSYTAQRRHRGKMHYMERSKLFNNIPNKLWELRGVPEPHSSAHLAKFGSTTVSGASSAYIARAAHVTDVNGYKVGQKVFSKNFGPGVILALEGSGAKAKARVTFFKDRKTRWLILQMAKLRAL